MSSKIKFTPLQEEQMVDMKKRGYTLQGIADVLGVHHKTVAKALNEYADRTGDSAVHTRKRKRKRKPPEDKQLCWGCEKALPGRGCEWADCFQPVDGWTAKPTLYAGNNGGKVRSYRITACPKFVKG